MKTTQSSTRKGKKDRYATIHLIRVTKYIKAENAKITFSTASL
jgi:hypothetical protein